MADVVIGELIAAGELARDGDRIRDPRRATGRSEQTREAMDRLEAALSVPCRLKCSHMGSEMSDERGTEAAILLGDRKVRVPG